jgi:hypothetical protein
MNPFEKKTEIDQRKAIDLLNKSSEDYNATINAARECLKLEQFKEYRKQFDETAKTLFQIFLLTPSTDVVTESIRVKLNAMALLGIDVLNLATLDLRKTRPMPKEEVKP